MCILLHGDFKWVSQVKNITLLPFCVVDANGTAYHVTDSGEQQ